MTSTKGKRAARKTQNLIGVRTHGGDGQFHVGNKRALASAGHRAHEPEQKAAAAKAAGKTNGAAARSGRGAAKGAHPNAPVPVVIADAKELLGVARRAGKKLTSVGLDARYLKELPERIELLARAQKAWQQVQARATPRALRDAREEAAQLKTDLLAAGRYVLRRDAAAQRELDKIAEGDGLEDLVNDLGALAEFWSQRREALAEADVPKDALTRARALATQLRVALADGDGKTREAREHRNRALAMLDEAVSEVRAAGRYAFRSAPARLALFRHEFRRMTAQKKAAKGGAEK